VPDWEALIHGSVFHLCPRGNGPSSYRLYEALQADTIPIYIWEGVGAPCSIYFYFYVYFCFCVCYFIVLSFLLLLLYLSLLSLLHYYNLFHFFKFIKYLKRHLL